MPSAEPLLILSGATTGLPRNGYEPKLIEAAAVVLVPGGAGGLTIAGPTNGRWSRTIGQAAADLLAPQAQPAKRIHGISDAEILSSPGVDGVAADFAKWLARVQSLLGQAGFQVRTWHVWNNSFWLRHFDQPPWSGPPGTPMFNLQLGRCAMDWTAAALLAINKNTRTKTGKVRSTGLKRAFDSYRTVAPGLDWNLGGADHRALPQACRVAQMVVLSSQIDIPVEKVSHDDLMRLTDPYGGY